MDTHAVQNKRMYTACYRELMEHNNTAHTCILLGDAYMNVQVCMWSVCCFPAGAAACACPDCEQEPERAIAVYESALKKNPRDGYVLAAGTPWC